MGALFGLAHQLAVQHIEAALLGGEAANLDPRGAHGVEDTGPERGGPGNDQLLAAVRQVAPASAWAGDELIVPGPASLRPRVLDAVRALSVEVRGLTAEEGRLDVLYRELVGETEKKSRAEDSR